MLFNGSNLSASADGLEWNGKKWSIVNHFIPFMESEVGADRRFESHFMIDYLADKTLSKEARAVLAEGRILWQEYFKEKNNRGIRDKLKLNRSDVGWYQIRNALKLRNGNSGKPCDFGPFEKAYAGLSEQLKPMVYELGFLK